MAEKILVIQTAFVGDLLLAVPLLRHLKKSFPASNLHLVARKGLAEPLLYYGLIDRLSEIDKAQPQDWKDLLGHLKKESYDWIFAPHMSPRTAFSIRSLKSKRKVGFHQWWNGFFFSDRVRRNMKLPDALRQLSLLSPVSEEWESKLNDPLLSGLLTTNAWQPIPEWASMHVPRISTHHLDILRGRYRTFNRSWEKIQTFLKTDADSGFVALAPGSVWLTKRWPDRRYRELGKKLFERGERVILFGSPSERLLCALVAEGIPGAKNLAGELTLFESIELLRSAKMLVTNDSGAMHMAAVANIPTVAIFGPTVQSLGYRPWQDRAVVIERELSCRPCGKHGSMRCPLGTHACMEAITAADVFRGTERFS